MISQNATLIGLYQRLVPGLQSRLDVMDMGVLVNPRSGLVRCLAQPQCQVKGMNMRRAHVERAANIFRAGADRLQLFPVQRFDLAIAVLVLQLFHIVMLVPHLGLGEPGMQDAGPQVALDVVLGHQVLDQILAVLGQVPQRAGIIAPGPFFQLILLNALA